MPDEDNMRVVAILVAGDDVVRDLVDIGPAPERTLE
jgi:hypothetical protein